MFRSDSPAGDCVFSHLLEGLFQRIEQNDDNRYFIGISCFDILGNDVVDLLSDNAKCNSM